MLPFISYAGPSSSPLYGEDHRHIIADLVVSAAKLMVIEQAVGRPCRDGNTEACRLVSDTTQRSSMQKIVIRSSAVVLPQF
jgi:hypothetical protein